MASWQLVIVLGVGSEELQLTQGEASELVAMLRTPNPYAPATEPGSISAAVFLERLLDDPKAENPPMNDDESGAILFALGRMMIDEGLTKRQRALHDALLAYHSAFP